MTFNTRCIYGESDTAKHKKTYFGVPLDADEHENESKAGQEKCRQHTHLMNLNIRNIANKE